MFFFFIFFNIIQTDACICLIRTLKSTSRSLTKTILHREIGGKRYAGNVKEKEKAKKQFEEAKSRGESAGHIAAS